MKLCNKKTGEIDKLIEYGNDVIPHEITEFVIETVDHEYKYTSLPELIKDWEDYKPTEPLIKDERIRKAVIFKAEALAGAIEQSVKEFIDDIAELCGEEE